MGSNPEAIRQKVKRKKEKKATQVDYGHIIYPT